MMVEPHNKFPDFLLKKAAHEVGDMAQQLRILDALSEDPGSILSTHN